MKLLPFLVLLPVGFAVGCGPTRTAGTQGIPADKLAVLHVTQQYDIPMMQVAAIGFDDHTDKYKIDGDRDFYLGPGVHPVALDLKAKVEGPMKWLASSFGADTTMPGPPGLSTGDLQAGKKYELRGLADTFQGMVQGMAAGGEMTVTREMDSK